MVSFYHPSKFIMIHIDPTDRTTQPIRQPAVPVLIISNVTEYGSVDQPLPQHNKPGLRMTGQLSRVIPQGRESNQQHIIPVLGIPFIPSALIHSKHQNK